VTVMRAPQALAPEKSDSLVPYLRQIRILPSEGKFILSASERFISVSEGALNLLRCTSYAAWFIYQAYVDAENNDLPSVQLGKDPEAVTALDLNEWAIRCVRTKKHGPWPSDAPRPSRTPPFALPSGSVTKIVNRPNHLIPFKF
jgi:hypothetical protein